MGIWVKVNSPIMGSSTRKNTMMKPTMHRTNLDGYADVITGAPYDNYGSSSDTGS